MKTTKLSLIFSIVLIIAGINALKAERQPGGNTSAEIKPSPIAYVVHIDNRNHFTGANQNYQIAITDETGRMVAEPQRFHSGEWYYTFYEQGPVKGTRIARMIRLPLTPGSGTITPCSKTGNFYGNTCYLFTIIPYHYAVPVGIDIP